MGLWQRPIVLTVMVMDTPNDPLYVHGTMDTTNDPPYIYIQIAKHTYDN